MYHVVSISTLVTGHHFSTTLQADTMCDVNIVSIDSRGRSTSDAAAFKEHNCSLTCFQHKIAQHPEACCHKSRVATLCGIDLKVYFHKGDEASTHVENKMQINQAATLLCMNPSTGFAKHHIRGVAYVVMNDGLAALSWNQVWGLVQLLNDASSYYQCDPDHEQRGKQELLKLINLYRQHFYGPLSIYKFRKKKGAFFVQVSSKKSESTKKQKADRKRKPFQSLQVWSDSVSKISVWLPRCTPHPHFLTINTSVTSLLR